MTEFVHGHLNREYVVLVERDFPNLGGDVSKQQAGTITEVVRPQESSQIVLFSVAISAMVVILIILIAVTVFMHHARMTDEEELTRRRRSWNPRRFRKQRHKCCHICETYSEFASFAFSRAVRNLCLL